MTTLSENRGKYSSSQAEIVPLAGKCPSAYSRGQMTEDDLPWHPRRLAERILAQAKKLGVAPTSVLKREDVADKALRDLQSGHWPSAKRVAELREAFQFESFDELLTGQPAAGGRCDPRILHIAIEMTAAALDSPQKENPLLTRPHVVAALAAVAYQELIELLKVDADALDKAAVLHLISRTLRSELARYDSEKS